MRKLTSVLLPFGLALCLPLAAPAQGFSSGSDGTDGALDYAANAGTIDFDPAALGIDRDADGVFHFTTISIQGGTTVRLKASLLGEGKGVVWLASGAVRIGGILDLDGRKGHAPNAPPLPSEAGAGGFSGGTGRTSLVRATSGSGPGGGAVVLNGTAECAGHAFAAGGPAYGNVFILPLVGGSGGAGGDAQPGVDGGGAGGGALLIASSVEIIVSGEVNARGGDSGETRIFDRGGAGSGGAIRLVAPRVVGGNLRVGGGYGPGANLCGSPGRIRVEAFTHSGTIPSPVEVVTFAQPGVLYLPANAPQVRVTGIRLADGTLVPVPPSAQGAFTVPDTVVNTPDPVTLELAAENVPLGTTVSIRVVPEGAARSPLTSTPLAGASAASSTATAGPVSLPTGFTRLFVTASFNP